LGAGMKAENVTTRAMVNRCSCHEPTATARGPLPAWMDLLVHAAAGNPTPPDAITITGDRPTFDRLVDALR